MTITRRNFLRGAAGGTAAAAVCATLAPSPAQARDNKPIPDQAVGLLYDSTLRTWDPWFASVVAFVLVLSIVITLVPGLHAKAVSPGEYPYDD